MTKEQKLEYFLKIPKDKTQDIINYYKENKDIQEDIDIIKKKDTFYSNLFSNNVTSNIKENSVKCENFFNILKINVDKQVDFYNSYQHCRQYIFEEIHKRKIVEEYKVFLDRIKNNENTSDIKTTFREDETEIVIDETENIINTIKRCIDDQEKLKNEFTSILQLDKVKQEKIFTKITQFDEDLLKKSHSYFIFHIYNYHISSKKINEEFVKKYFKRFFIKIHQHKKSDSLESQLKKDKLRESSYRLVQKIKKEDKNLYDKLSLQETFHLYEDISRRHEIEESSLFRRKSKNNKKRIEIFQNEQLNSRTYQRLLINISKNRIYTPEYVMFDFVLYVFQKLKGQVLIEDNQPRFSYEYFMNKSILQTSVMLNEIFVPYGFSYHSSVNDEIISFEELSEATYSSNLKFQEILLKKYKTHQSIIYLYYALSQNLNLSEYCAKRIKSGLNNLSFSYPYSKNTNTLLSLITGNIIKLYPNVDMNECDNENDDKVKLNIFKINRIVKNNSYLLLEEQAKEIMFMKSNTLINYFMSINNLLENISKNYDDYNEIDSKFYHYVYYIFDLIENDYRCFYYKKFYFSHIINKVKIDHFFTNSEYELKLFLEYMKMKSNLYAVINNDKSKKFEYHQKELKKFYEMNFGEKGEFYKLLKEKIEIFPDVKINFEEQLDLENISTVDNKLKEILKEMED